MTAAPTASASAAVRSLRVASTQTKTGQSSSLADTASPNATAGGQTDSRYLQTTASANASGIDTFPSSTPLIVGTQMAAAA